MRAVVDNEERTLNDVRFKFFFMAFLLLLTPAWAGDEACVVCSAQQARFHLESCSFSTDWQGKTYHFCEQGCLDTFNQNPKEWVAKFDALEQQARTATSLPAFRFPLEPVGSLSSEDLVGKIVVINLWATWCGPCTEEMPDLVRLQEEYGDKGVAVIAISFDKTKEAHRQGVKDLNLNFPSIYGDQKAVQDFLNALGQVSAIPVTFIVDSQGKIVERLEGKNDFAKFVQTIEPLLPEPQGSTEEANYNSVAPS
jgi:thiol-disulfide isomerase/thioredoxin